MQLFQFKPMTFIAVIAGALAFCGCTKEPPCPKSGGQGLCRTTFTFTPTPGEGLSPLVLAPSDENYITDVNLYAFHTTAAFSRHIYRTSGMASVPLELLHGNYEVYAVANVGTDLGEKTPAQLLGLRYTISDEEQIERHSRLLMAGRVNISVTADGNFSLPLERLVSKTEISCTVDGAAVGHLTVQAVQVCSAPASCGYFGENATANAAGKIDYAPVPWTSGTFARTFYLLENCQGTNPAVTTPQLKNYLNAPQFASYLRIQGLYDGRAVTYNVYLGENTTTNFNLHRNHRYVVNITLTGGNTDDYRVTMCDLALTPLAPSYKYGERARSSLTLAAENATGNVYSLSYRIVKGWGTLRLDGFSLTEGEQTPYLVGGDPARSSTLTFDPVGKGEVQIDITSTDIYGQQLTKSLRTVYEEENPIKIKFSGPATVPSNEISEITMSLFEVGYTGRFTVLFESLIEPHRTNLYFENFIIHEPIYPDNLCNGDFRIHTYPEKNYSGPAHLRVTVRDNKGNENTADLKLTVTP